MLLLLRNSATNTVGDSFNTPDGTLDSRWSTRGNASSGAVSTAFAQVTGGRVRLTTNSTTKYYGSRAMLEGVNWSTNNVVEAVVKVTPQFSTEGYISIFVGGAVGGAGTYNNYLSPVSLNFELNVSQTGLSIYETDADGNGQNLVGGSVGYTVDASRTWWMKIRVEGTVIHAKAWVTTDTEPNYWHAEAVASRAYTGGVGFGVQNGGTDGTTNSAIFDDFSATVTTNTVVLAEAFSASDGAAWPTGWTKGSNGSGSVQSGAGQLTSSTSTTAGAGYSRSIASVGTGDFDAWLTFTTTVQSAEDLFVAFGNTVAPAGGGEQLLQNGLSLEVDIFNSSANGNYGLDVSANNAYASPDPYVSGVQPIAANTPYRAHLWRRGGTFYGVVWPVGQTEPAPLALTHSLVATSVSLINLGNLTVSSGNARTINWDDVLVTKPSATAAGDIKVYLGGSFVAKPVKYWTGSAWVTKPLKRWNGSSWVVTPY